MQRWRSLPLWLRWMLGAAIVVLVISVVQRFGMDDTQQLTSVTAAQVMLRWCIPILLAGLGGLYSERSGVVNIGLEGMMIIGTWCGAWGAYLGGPWGGIAAGLIGGALGGALHAMATVTFNVDQIISGVAINILAPGVARYLSGQVFSDWDGGSITQSPRVDGTAEVSMPVLAGGFGTPDVLGWIGDREWFYLSDLANLTKGLMYEVSLFTLLGLAIVPLTAFMVWRTRFGLRLRIAGEDPVAGETLGVAITRYKYIGVVLSGALSGLGGAFIVIELANIYREGQTNGRGFIGLAALIFGNWRPGGVLAGSLLFSYPEGVALRDLTGGASHALLLVVTIGLVFVLIRSLLRRRRFDSIMAGVLAVLTAIWYFSTDEVPDWLPNVMPYALVLLVLIFNSQRLRVPKALGLPYRKGG